MGCSSETRPLIFGNHQAPGRCDERRASEKKKKKKHGRILRILRIFCKWYLWFVSASSIHHNTSTGWILRNIAIYHHLPIVSYCDDTGAEGKTLHALHTRKSTRCYRERLIQVPFPLCLPAGRGQVHLGPKLAKDSNEKKEQGRWHATHATR